MILQEKQRTDVSMYILMFSTEIDAHPCDVIKDVTKIVNSYVKSDENDESRRIRS